MRTLRTIPEVRAALMQARGWHGLAARDQTHEPLTRLGKRHHRRRGAEAFRVGNHLGLAAFRGFAAGRLWQFQSKEVVVSVVAWIILGLVSGFIGSKIVNKSGETVISVEALCRWTHPTRGEIPPSEHSTRSACAP